MPLILEYGQRIKATVPLEVVGITSGRIVVRGVVVSAAGLQVGRFWSGPPGGTPENPQTAGLTDFVQLPVQSSNPSQPVRLAATLYTAPLAGADAVAYPASIVWSVELYDAQGRKLAEAQQRDDAVFSVGHRPRVTIGQVQYVAA